MRIKRWPKLGTRIHVQWMDIVGHVNAPLGEATPARCWTEGILVKNEKMYIVLASSQFIENNSEGDMTVGDYTAIPKGVISSFEKI